MRRIALLAFTVLSPFPLALSCTSDINTVDGSGGSGSTSASNTVTNATTAVTTGSTQSSTSTGPGNTCDQGCAHVEECLNFDGCGQVGVDCQNPMFECPGQCLLDASCADIQALAQMNPPPSLQGCLSACQGGQGGQGGGSTQQQCGTCLVQNGCLSACQNDQACQAWGGCAMNCATPACFSDCNAMHPAAQTAYEAVYACACAGCMGDCGTLMDPCNQGGGTGGAGGAGGGGGAGGN